MARDYSSGFTRNLLSINPGEPVLFLLEINHAILEEPIRLARDNQDFSFQGYNFIACSFDIVLLTDEDNAVPTAQIGINNIGGPLVNWIEQAEGAAGATVKIIMLQRSNTEAEFEIETSLKNVNVTMAKITAQIGFDDILNKSSVQIKYDAYDAPGLI